MSGTSGVRFRPPEWRGEIFVVRRIVGRLENYHVDADGDGARAIDELEQVGEESSIDRRTRRQRLDGGIIDRDDGNPRVRFGDGRGVVGDGDIVEQLLDVVDDLGIDERDNDAGDQRNHQDAFDQEAGASSPATTFGVTGSLGSHRFPTQPAAP